MRNNKLMLVLIFACFLMLPFKVFAESKVCESVSIELEDIKLGEKWQESTYAIGGSHFISPIINIVWYESSNGSDYALMDEDSTFDYNIYYKAVLNTSYDELNSGMDEGWEICGLSIDIIDETGGNIDSKNYSGNSKLEYIFQPFWKYKVNLVLENLDYNGPTEIAKGEELIGQLVPNKNYRLPNDEEAKNWGMVIINVNGNTNNNYYNSHNGIIEIASQDINGHIEIHARAVEMTKIEFENNKYVYDKYNENNSLEFSVPFNDDIDTLYINEKIISDNNYYYDKSNGILNIHEEFLDTLETGTYKLRIENKERYAETTLSIKNKFFTVIFDANGGIFKKGNILTIEKWENGLENSLEKPIKTGYAFKGYYTQKTGGTKFELILAESGIDSDMTFYAQWEETSSVVPEDSESEDSEIAPSEPEDENPNTLDSIRYSVIMIILSIIGFVVATVYLKKHEIKD